MSLLAQRIDHLLNGVSQRPEVQRRSSELEDSKNALALQALGLAKRPPAQHRGKLSATSWDFDKAETHTINRDENDQFRVAVQGGQVKVFDVLDDGAEVVVRDKTPDSQAYLSDTGEGYRMVTVGDTTVIVNRGKVTSKGSTKSPKAKLEEAYITVEQADFSTPYTITLDGRSVTYRTVDQVDARSRGQITTEFIAKKLEDRLKSGQFSSDLYFKIKRFGNTIRIAPKRSDQTYEISVSDGLAGNGLHLVKGEAQSIEDLPARAKHGAVINVTGDPRRDEDDFYVEYDASQAGDSEHGVWKETVAPGILQDFDASTMPHALVMKGPLIEPGLTAKDLPSRPSIATRTETEEIAGWTEKRVPSSEVTDPKIGDDTLSETVEAVREEIDDFLDRHKGRLRRPVPNADGTERDLDVAFSVDTSLVRTGIETRVNVSKVDTNGNRTLLEQKSFEPGDTFPDETVEIRKEAFASGDEIEIELEYGDGLDQPLDRRAELEAPGKKSLITGYEKTLVPAIKLRKRRFVEVTYDYGQAWPEGTDITVELDSTATFTHTVPAGGQTDAEVAAAMASLIDANASYQASNTAGSPTVEISNSGGTTYPIVTDTEASVAGSVFYNPDLSLQADELVNFEARNLTDGSSGTISGNTANTITCSLSGGVDNKWSPGDVIEVEGTDRYFVLRPIEWDLREAGDDESNPFPSFTGRKIRDVFFYRNRLGFVAGENIILSRSGDLFQFFRTSAADLLDDDRIDIRSAHSEISLFHSGFVWNGGLNLWTDSAQFVLGGDPVLTPRTVALDLVSRFPNDPDVPPVVGGPDLFFVHSEEGSTRVYRYVPETPNRPAEAVDLTRHVPTYLKGAPRDLAVDAGLGVLAVATKGDPQAIFVFTWTESGNRVAHAGWNRWELPAGSTVGKLDTVEGRLGIISTHGTDGTYLNEIDLDVSVTPSGNEQGRYLDRRVDSATDALSPTYNSTSDETTWTLPYTPQDSAKVRVFRRDTHTVLDPAVSGTSVTVSGDLTTVDVWIGTIVPFRAELSPIRIRDRQEMGETRGRLQLRNLEVEYHDTTDLDVKVTPKGRAQYTKSLPLASPRDGTLRVPMLSRAEDTEIVLENSSPGGARVSSLSWEGLFNRRSRRL